MSVNFRYSPVLWFTLIILFILTPSIEGFAFDWVPTEEELAKYRRSWNPPTPGTSFTSNADVTSKVSGLSAPMSKA